MKMVNSIWRTLSAAFLLATATQAQDNSYNNDTTPLSQYKSRPDLYAPFLNVTTYVEGSVTPGYIFMSPYQTEQDGLYIYDNRGNLVYSGHGQSAGSTTHNLHVCNVGDDTRLCYFAGTQYRGYARGHVAMLNDQYRVVSTLQVMNGHSALDQHEFHMVDNGSAALLTTYTPRQVDMSEYNVTSGMGWVQDCIFQKVDTETNELLFEWAALDHVSLSETWVLPNGSEVAGDGLQPTSPWDYFHINAIDQTANGDFLVSARHTSTIYRINGETGNVIWRMGGTTSDFELGDGVLFGYQHDIRIQEEGDAFMIVSLFDNADNGFTNQTSDFSSGKILRLNTTSRPYQATLVSRFEIPDQYISSSQGNTQLLRGNNRQRGWETSNVFIGWGSQPAISEHAPGNPGPIVQHASFAVSPSMNYRAYKANWTSNPVDAPALYTYAQSSNDNASTVFYMSWNGATRPTDWTLYGKQQACDSWTRIDTVPKQGFETVHTADGFWPYTMIEAMDGSTRLRNSTTTSGGTRTFVPGPALVGSCDGSGCATASTYGAAQASTTAGSTATTVPACAASQTSSSASSTSSSAAMSRHGLPVVRPMSKDGHFRGPLSAAAMIGTGVTIGAWLMF